MPKLGARDGWPGRHLCGAPLSISRGPLHCALKRDTDFAPVLGANCCRAMGDGCNAMTTGRRLQVKPARGAPDMLVLMGFRTLSS